MKKPTDLRDYMPQITMETTFFDDLVGYARNLFAAIGLVAFALLVIACAWGIVG
jgi:hypothetical protein